MALKRTESMILLPTPDRPIAHYKEQRQRRKHSSSRLTIRIPKSSPSTTTTKKIAPSQVILPSVASPITTVLTPRSSSPLSPNRVSLPGRPVFPRSKNPEPDLYKLAIRMRMLLSPEGQKILHLGPRAAMELEVNRMMQVDVDVGVRQVKEQADRTRREIVNVTRDLEKMVQDICDEDVLMDCMSTPAPPILTTSWVLVKGEDLEMVDCTT